jgi:hypothetical protein
MVLKMITGFLAVTVIFLAVGEWYVAKKARDDVSLLVGACYKSASDSTTKNGSGGKSISDLSARARDSIKTSSSPSSGNDGNSPCSLDRETAKDIIAHYDAEVSGFHTFELEIFKTVLLNVLLPVLTALLGYVFGSNRSET